MRIGPAPIAARMPAVPKASEPSKRPASAAAASTASPAPSSWSSSALVSGSGSASRQAKAVAARPLSGTVIRALLAASPGDQNQSSQGYNLGHERTAWPPAGSDVPAGDRRDRRLLSAGATAQRRATGFVSRPPRVRGGRLHPR